MATKGVRHTLAVTLNTCFHDKEGVKLISTYLDTRSIDSVYIDSTDNDSLFKVCLRSTTTKKKKKKKFRPIYPVFFHHETVNRASSSFFFFFKIFGLLLLTWIIPKTYSYGEVTKLTETGNEA